MMRRSLGGARPYGQTVVERRHYKSSVNQCHSESPQFFVGCGQRPGICGNKCPRSRNARNNLFRMVFFTTD